MGKTHTIVTMEDRVRELLWNLAGEIEETANVAKAPTADELRDYARRLDDMAGKLDAA